MSNQPPIEVPQGAIRLNTDSQKLEFYAQDRWFEMATDVPTLDGGARGFVSGGLQNPAEINNIDQITIPTQGNAIDFGNLTQVSRLGGTTASRTRAVRMAGIHGGNATGVVDLTYVYILFIFMTDHRDCQSNHHPHFEQRADHQSLGHYQSLKM